MIDVIGTDAGAPGSLPPGAQRLVEQRVQAYYSLLSRHRVQRLTPYLSANDACFSCAFVPPAASNCWLLQLLSPLVVFLI